jgi:hypothetical protein
MNNINSILTLCDQRTRVEYSIYRTYIGVKYD